jgi:acyl carrier protein
MERVAREQNQTLVSPLADDLPLLQTGLDSLALAILVVRLEEALGFDPFTASNEIFYPTTLIDLIRFYEEYRVPTTS